MNLEAGATATRERRELLVLFVLVLATRVLYVYRSGAPEPDTIAMIAGMAIGMAGDVSPGDAFLYGRHVNPGMHWLVANTFPLFRVSPSALLPVLNWGCAICASLMVFPVYALLRPHLPRRATIASIGIWVTTPVVWESGTYYHPLIPAALLMLLALVCARRVDVTARGAGWGLLTLLLACGAFVLRVEVLVVWPALLVWTLTSARGRRNTGILLAVSAASAAVYILTTRAMAETTTSGAAPDLAGYVQMLRDMYSHSMSLRALPRSVTWMACAMGIATLAACIAGWRGAPLRGRHRVTAAALVWMAPSILFWLPQPVPIVRHYLLATVGLAALLGVLVLERWKDRRIELVTAAIVAGNLLVPEIAYRAYNAGPTADKTPHGAFFYYHELARERIDATLQLARRIVACGPDEGAPAKSCAVVQWEQFSYVAYAAATGGSRVEPEPVETIVPGVRYVRFRVGDGEVRLIHYTYLEDDSLRATVARIMQDSHDEGFCLFAPRALCERTPQFQALRNQIDCY